MRFAYIDSQGKEVGIPSVEALQLRIELGAIGEGTMFFDASTEKWAPAKEHEIFRTLSRETKDKDEGGFVAPPPPTMLRMQWPPPDQREEKEEAPASEPEASEPEASEPEAPEPEAPEPAVEEPAAAEPPAPEPEPPAEEPAQPAAGGDAFDFGDLGLVDDEPAAAEEPPAELPGMTAPEPEMSAEESAGADDSLDFGEFGALDLEPTPAAEEPAAEEPGAGVPDMTAPEPELTPTDAGDEEEPSSFDFGAGLEMEAPEMGDEEEEAPAASPSGMDLEQPLSEYSPEEPPSWMDEEDGEDGGLELEDAAAAAYGASTAEDDAPARRGGGGDGSSRGDRGGRGGRGEDGGDSGDDGGERGRRSDRRPPRARPARVREKKSKVGAIVGVIVVLGALGAGGWFGWNYLQDRQAAQGPVEPEVPIPEIAAYLEPTLEEAAAPAYAMMIDSLRSMTAVLPDQPTEEWLSGNYLANASQFTGVQSYWEDLRDHLDRIQERDEEIFMHAFEAQMDSLNMVGEDRTALEERARAGFQAARPDRRIVYDQLDGLIQASLELHDFLLGNEDAIEYSPAVGGLSRDPVTEAVPSSEALGEEMWDRVAQITTALDNLGALDRVSTDRILGIVFDKLARTSIR